MQRVTMILRLDRLLKTVVLLIILSTPLLLMAVEYNYHRVRQGDTLYSIGRRYGVSVTELKRLNNLSSDNLSINQRLKVSVRQPAPRPTTPTPAPSPTPSTPSPTPTTNPPASPPTAPAFQRNMNLPPEYYHTVVQGEGLYRIAVNNSISLQQLLEYNGFENANIPIRPGDKIIIKDPELAGAPVDTEAAAAAARAEQAGAETVQPVATPRTPAPSDTVVVQQVYIVQRGDTLYRIATNNGITVDDLKRRNNLSSNEISVGQRLYIVGTPSGRPPVRTPQVTESESGKLRNDLIMPIEGRVSSRYGIRNGRPHKGVDISARTGTPIYAVLDGTVVYSGTQGGYGNVVVLEHPDFVMTIYAHNERNLVSVGDVVRQGQQIATVGTTGSTTGSHVHFEYRIKGKPINPNRVLPID